MAIATNRSATALALSTVLPFTASVSSEADARRMAAGPLEADVPSHLPLHRLSPEQKVVFREQLPVLGQEVEKLFGPILPTEEAEGMENTSDP